MKYLLISFIALFICLGCKQDAVISTKPDVQSDKNQITKVMMAQEKAWNDADLEGFMSGYWKSDSLTFIGSRGLSKGWSQTLTNYKKSYPDKATMGALKFEIIQLNILSNEAAHMIGRYTLVREDDQPTGLFTLIWKKIGGEWLIVSDQSC